MSRTSSVSVLLAALVACCLCCPAPLAAQNVIDDASMRATIDGVAARAREFERTGVRVTNITLGAPGSWAMVGHNGASWYHAVPQAMMDRAQAVYRDGAQILVYSLGPQNEWAVTNSGGWWLGVDRNGILDKAWEFHNAGELPRHVSYGPNGSWTLVSATGRWWWVGANGPEGLVDRVRATCSEDNPVLQIALGPERSYAVLCRGGVWWMGNVPMSMVERARAFQRQHGDIVSMAFGPDGLWAMVSINGGWWIGPGW